MAKFDAVASFSSDFVEIVAGTGQKKLRAHTAFLSKSNKLKALIEAQSSDRCRISLPDWDEETVARLLEWFYTGDYNCPFPEALEHNGRGPQIPNRQCFFDGFTNQNCSDEEDEEDEEDENLEDGWVGEEPYRPLTPITELKADRSYPFDPYSSVGKPHSEHILDWTEEYFGDVNREFFDYTITLLAYAKLYTLASYAVLPALQCITFGHIKTWFSHIGVLTDWEENIRKARSRMVSTLIVMAKYAYANTPNTSEEPLRKLISTYIASNVIHFGGKGVCELMEAGGDLVTDVWEKVRRVGKSMEDSHAVIEGWSQSSSGRVQPAKCKKRKASYLPASDSEKGDYNLQ